MSGRRARAIHAEAARLGALGRTIVVDGANLREIRGTVPLARYMRRRYTRTGVLPLVGIAAR